MSPQALFGTSDLKKIEINILYYSYRIAKRCDENMILGLTNFGRNKIILGENIEY